MSEPTTDPMPLWRAAALLRCELQHGEPDNEVQARMLAHFCERAARGGETARVVVEVMGPELRAWWLAVLERLLEPSLLRGVAGVEEGHGGESGGSQEYRVDPHEHVREGQANPGRTWGCGGTGLEAASESKHSSWWPPDTGSWT